MKKIFTSILMVAIGALVVPCAVNAEPVTVNGEGERTQDATVQEIIDADTYDIELEWGALTYTYKKVAGDNYTWEPTNEGSNVVKVSNRRSTTKITATIGWTSSINDVVANMAGKYSDGSLVCNKVLDENQPPQWANNAPEGNYLHSDDANEVFYTDNSCTIEVADNTPYVADTFYRKDLHEELLNETSVVLDYQAGEEDVTIEAAGWEVELTGGSLEDVQSAFNGTKKIGTVTVTIAKYVAPVQP